MRIADRVRDEVRALPGAFWYLWVGTLVNRIGAFVLPFLALFLTSRRGLTPGDAALVVALYGGGGFAASLAGGAIADRFGRRTALLTSLLCGAAAMLVVPAVRGVAALALAVAALGFFGELYRPAVAAAVADLVPDAGRPRAYALLYWVTNIGAALAPLLAGLIAARSYTALFVVDAVTMGAYALLVWARVPETRPPRAAGEAEGSSGGEWGVALRDPALLVHSGLMLLVASVLFQAFTTLPLSMRADGLDEATYGLVIAVNGGLVVLLSLPAADVAARFRPTYVLAAGAVLMGVGFGLTGPAATAPGYAGTVVVWTLAEIVVLPVGLTLVARLSPEHLRGAYQGVYHAAWGLALLVGPAVGGQVFERLGEAPLWTGCLAACLVAAIGFLLLSGRSPSPGADRAAPADDPAGPGGDPMPSGA